MKASELRELTVEELKQRESDLSEELFNLRFQLATAQLENKMRVPQVKKDLARVKTLIKERQG
jgi:large subunit ribosomal protein L29